MYVLVTIFRCVSPDEHSECIARVMRATAVIGVRPPTVLSFEHSHVDVSQSQSHEWPGGLVEGW